MARQSIFECTDYRKYTLDCLDERKARGGRGVRTKFARAIGCQSSYISRVFSGDAHLSLEQGDLANDFLQHTSEESIFFILLIEHARAGTPGLQLHFQTQIERHRQQYLNLKNRFKEQPSLSEEDQAIYFDSWLYVAVHVLMSIPELANIDRISEKLRIPRKRAIEIIDFLVSTGLLTTEGDRYNVGTTRMHLPGDSRFISRHHTHWRLQAIRSLDNQRDWDLHYSSVVTVSRSDLALIKSKIVDALAECKAIIRDSNDETACVFSIDFFQLID